MTRIHPHEDTVWTRHSKDNLHSLAPSIVKHNPTARLLQRGEVHMEGTTWRL